jgi:S1-C subfamily serine protease
VKSCRECLFLENMLNSLKNKLSILVVFLFNSLFLESQILSNNWINCNNENCKVFNNSSYGIDSVAWDGQCYSGKAQGFGKLFMFRKGQLESCYEGNCAEGVATGRGRIVYSDSSVKEGSFVNGQLIGFGKYISSSGDKYEGNFINGVIHGMGRMHYLNGTKFNGFFVNGAHYTGEFTSTDSKIYKIYKGDYVDELLMDSNTYQPQLGVKLTEYFDQDWKRCAMGDAFYFRVVTYSEKNTPIGIIKDYYINGSLQSQYMAVYIDYQDEGKNFYVGDLTFYYSSGVVEKKCTFIDNSIQGKVFQYYDNGKLMSEEDYEFGALNGESKFWYQSGNIKLYALYDQGDLVENKFIEYDEMGSGSLIYEEDFNKPEWSVTNEYSESYLNDNEDLVLKISTESAQARMGYIDLDQKGDFSIESTITKFSSKKKSEYGLLFGFKDWDNFYEFTISDNGRFSVYGVVNGVSEFIASPTKTNAIYKGDKGNILKLFSVKDKFNFSINGVIVLETDGWWFQGNNYGFIASAKGGYVFENLIVRENLTEEELQEQGPTMSKENWIGFGTGFFIHPNGYIATAYHVVEDADTVEVEYFQKGEKFIFRADVISTDTLNDLAIIQIRDPKFITLSQIPYVFVDNTCDVGSDVFALGYPDPQQMGTEIKFTDGKVSSKTGFQGERNIYQTTVPIYGGNSGGPLFDIKGNLVGINNSTLGNLEAVTYAVKSNYLKVLTESIPGSITCPNYTDIYNKPLTEKIKLISDFVPLIRVK